MGKSRSSKRFPILIIVFLILVSTSGCQDKADSRMPVVPKVIDNFPLMEHWRRGFDGKVKAMALGSGRLVAGIIGDNDAIIQAFDIGSGSSLWQIKLSGKGIGIQIVVVDSVVYIIYAPKLFAVNLDTGNPIFEIDIHASIGDEVGAISDEHIYIVQLSEGVYAYDKLTGKQSWKILVGRGNVDVFLDSVHDLVYIVHGETLSAVSEQDGSLAWQFPIGFHGAVGYKDGILYYSASEINVEAKTQIRALDVGRKTQIWENKLGRGIDCLAMENNGLVAINKETMAIFDPRSGERAWEYFIPLGVYCPIVALEGVIYLKDGFSNQIIAMQQGENTLTLLGRVDFQDPEGIGYEIPKDNLLGSTYPFPLIAFYLDNLVFVFK